MVIKAKANTIKPPNSRKGGNRAKNVSKRVVKPKKYKASIYSDIEMPKEFIETVLAIESEIKMPLLLMIQNPGNKCSYINKLVYEAIKTSKNITKKPCALLIDSSGGDADSAYKIARLFQRRCDAFTIIIPKYAKSAATLLALGADEIIMAKDAEIGPLDVQILDYEKEEAGAALDAVQSLERINAFSMSSIDSLMSLLMGRTGKKIETLLPLVLKYSVEFVKPLLEKIDTVQYTKLSRSLKVAEEYAVRLMKKKYGWETSKEIARQLVEKYPAHSFVIDRNEATTREKVSDNEIFGLGLNLLKQNDIIDNLLDKLAPFLDHITVIGRIEEDKNE